MDETLGKEIVVQLETTCDLLCRMVTLQIKGNTVGVSSIDLLCYECLELAPDSRELDVCALHEFPWLG